MTQYVGGIDDQSISGIIDGAPVDPATPATWLRVYIGGVTYWLPLYQ